MHNNNARQARSTNPTEHISKKYRSQTSMEHTRIPSFPHVHSCLCPYALLWVPLDFPHRVPDWKYPHLLAVSYALPSSTVNLGIERVCRVCNCQIVPRHLLTSPSQDLSSVVYFYHHLERTNDLLLVRSNYIWYVPALSSLKQTSFRTWNKKTWSFVFSYGTLGISLVLTRKRR